MVGCGWLQFPILVKRFQASRQRRLQVVVDVLRSAGLSAGAQIQVARLKRYQVGIGAEDLMLPLQ